MKECQTQRNTIGKGEKAQEANVEINKNYICTYVYEFMYFYD